VQRIKYKKLDHWQYQHLDIIFELLTGFKKNCEKWIGNKETASHPWTASPKGSGTSLVCSQKTGRKWADAVRRSPRSRITKLMEYVDSIEYPLIQIVRTHQQNTTEQCYRQLEASWENY
jgi:hypothetical protein